MIKIYSVRFRPHKSASQLSVGHIFLLLLTNLLTKFFAMTLCLNDERDNVTQGRERTFINFLSHPCVAVVANVLEDYCSLPLARIEAQPYRSYRLIRLKAAALAGTAVGCAAINSSAGETPSRERVTTSTKPTP